MLKLLPFDRLALSLIFVLSLLMGLLVWGGQACGTNCFLRFGSQVQFSWQNQQISAEDTAFILTFERPVDKASVEQNLAIEPPLPGKISWAGRKLAYTLETPAPYGESYQLSLQGAKVMVNEEVLPPFEGEFRSRDRAFAYIGSEGKEQGRLIFFNLTRDTKIISTPADLVVSDFQFYPQGDKILFAAAPSGASNRLQSLRLYTVTTKNQPQIELILDNQHYQNHKFNITPDGQSIVVQRVNRQDPSDFGLWLIKAHQKPKSLNISGGEFLIAPDGQTLAVAQGEGISLLPLEPEAELLDFLPQFGRILSFSPDGSAAAMVNFNTNDPQRRYTRSLYYVTNQGVQKELLNIQGSIVDCQFTPSSSALYCLLTELLEGEEYQEQPYFAKIDLETAEIQPLLTLPSYQDLQLSLAPDGLGLLFDQIMSADIPMPDAPVADSGEAIVGSRLWMLILPSTGSENTQPQLEPLPLAGIRPQWMP